jgi:hypothetical protein
MTQRDDAARAVDTLSFRTRAGILADVYLFGDGSGTIWYNDGPPRQHQTLTEEGLEEAIARGDLRDSWTAEGVEMF